MSYSQSELVRWSLENPSPGYEWAGYRRIMDHFGCLRCNAQEASVAAKEMVEDGKAAKFLSRCDNVGGVVEEEEEKDVVVPGGEDLKDVLSEKDFSNAKEEHEEVEEIEPHKNATDEEIIAWGLCHPSESKLIASSKMLKDEFSITRPRARNLLRETRKKARSLLSGAEGESHEGATISLEGDNLDATVMTQTEPGEEPGMEEVLENPKLKRALSSSDINIDDFEVTSFKARSWDVTMKHEGKKTNHYISVKWERKAPNPILTATRNIIADMPDKSKIYCDTDLSEYEGKYMCEVALYDVHFGMLAWAAETGEDYDVTIASRVVEEVTKKIVARTKHRDIDHFLLPIGNDWLHINDVTELTPRGGNRLDVDTRLCKILEESERSMFNLIDNLREVAPVRIMWIPGNHDPQTSYHLLRLLNTRHENDNMVDVNTSPKPRKVYTYGPNLIGFLHGCNIPKSRIKELPNLVMTEAAEEGKITKDQYREIHKAHKHSKNSLHFKGLSNHGSFNIRGIPSITGTDYWSFENGFAHSSKAAQFFMWPDDAPLESVNDVHVSNDLYKQEERFGPKAKDSRESARFNSSGF